MTARHSATRASTGIQPDFRYAAGSLADWEERPAAPLLPRLVRGFFKQNAASIIGEPG